MPLLKKAMIPIQRSFNMKAWFGIIAFAFSFWLISCNTEDELLEDVSIPEKKTISEPTHAMIKLNGQLRYNEDEILKALQEERVTAIGAYVSTLEGYEKYPPRSQDIGMVLPNQGKVCPFCMTLSGSSNQDMYLVVKTGEYAMLRYNLGSDSWCEVNFSENGPYFRYVPYNTVNYLFLRFGANTYRDTWSGSYSITYDSYAIDINNLEISYISDRDYQLMKKIPIQQGS